MGACAHTHTNKNKNRQTDGHKKEKKCKKPTFLSMLVPQILSICIIH